MTKNHPIALAITGYSLLVRCASALQSPFLLVMRLVWGWAFFQTGWGKLMNHAQIVEFFASLNIPAPDLNAWVAGTIECFGGLLLLLGLASRLVTIPLIITMAVAYMTAHSETILGIFRDPDPFTSAEPFLFLLTAVLVFIFGPGAFSLDGIIKRRMFPNSVSTRTDLEPFACSQAGAPARSKNR